MSEREPEQDEASETEIQYAALLRSVRRAALRLVERATCGRDDVDRAATTVHTPPVSAALLARVMSGNVLDAMGVLVCSTVLRRAIQGTPLEQPWSAQLGRSAAAALLEMRRPSLFELALELLDELIAQAPAEISLAEMYFNRASLRHALVAKDKESIRRVRADLQHAIVWAEEEGNLDAHVNSVALLVKLASGADIAGEDRAAVGVALDHHIGGLLDSSPLSAHQQMLLLQARAVNAQRRGPGEVIAPLEAALALGAPGDPLWIELTAQLVTTLCEAGRPADAVTRGLAALAKPACRDHGIPLAMLQLTVGDALARSGLIAEAGRHLMAGLEGVRGREHRLEIIARLQLAALGIGAADEKFADEHLRHLADRWADLDDVQRGDVADLRAWAAAMRSDGVAQRAALGEAITLVHREPRRTQLLLRQALVELASQHDVADLDGLVARAIGQAPGCGLETLLCQLASEHAAALAPATQELLRDWARRHGRPSLVARLLVFEDRTPEAVTGLREALRAELPADERLQCVQLLVRSLKSSDVEELRELCREFAELLEQPGDHAHARLDLAHALRLTAGRDLDVMRSAWKHAMRALEGVNDPSVVTHAHRLLVNLALDIGAASLPASTVDAAEKAAWLERELRLPAAELGAARGRAASCLLVPGPLMHPRARLVAAGLLALARAHLARGGPRDKTGETLAAHEDLLTASERRLAWIEDRLAGRAAAREANNRFPFDHAPPWLIDWLTGRRPAPDEIAWESAEFLAHAQSARPDLSEQFRTVLQRVAVANVSPGDPRRIAELAQLGLTLMEEVRRDPTAPDVRNKITAARSSLDDAVTTARAARATRPSVDLFGCLVLLGTAWRMLPDPDIERALACYEEARLLNVSGPACATLWKAHADALYLRGSADDLRHAEALLARALEVWRDGPLRAEVLFSAAQVARRHPDRNEVERTLRAADHLMAAARTAPGRAEQVLHILVMCLTDWSRHAPADERPRRYREELRQLYPHRATELEARSGEADPLFTIATHQMFAHPAARTLLEIRTRLLAPHERRTGLHQARARLGSFLDAALLDRIEERTARESLLGRPDEAERVLARLATAADPAERPGALAGEVLILALLARAGRRSVTEVRAHTEAAIAAAETVDAPLVRALILRELAYVWAPADHAADAVRDFALAATLLWQAVALEGGEATALIDTLSLLAQALRYGGDPAGANLRESRRLYRLVLERARAECDPDRIARLLCNLAEVEANIGEGESVTRLRHAEQLLDEAVRTAQSPDVRAACEMALAWTCAQLGDVLKGREGFAWLERAQSTFACIDRDQLAPPDRKVFDSLRATYSAQIEERSGGRASALALCRQQLTEAVASGSPLSIADARRFLANALMYDEGVTAEELQEGLTLAREAATMQAVEGDARRHWQITFDAGCAIADQLDRGRDAALPMSRREAWTEAYGWLSRAITAARALGPGEELAETGFALVHIAVHAASTAQVIEVAETAWDAVREAMAFLLAAPRKREREAWHASLVAHVLAQRLADEGMTAVAPGLAFMLTGGCAKVVERWLLRTQLPARRLLRARLAPPQGVSPLTWQAWNAALRTATPHVISAALERIRAEAPAFLAEDGDIEPTILWLAARKGSAAVAAFLAERGLLAWLVTVDDQGRRQACILGLDAPAPPLAPEKLAACMSEPLLIPDSHQAQAESGAWARRYLAEPIERVLGAPPSALLWCPGPGLRLIAPTAIWTSSTVSVTTAMEGPARREAPSRHRSTLIALADPGPGAERELGAHGIEVVEHLAQAAEVRGPVRRMGSAGRCFGRALFKTSPGVRNTPASPQDLLQEAAEHDFVVLFAHGGLTADGAALHCLDGEGKMALLTDAMLAEAPEAFAGSTVVLLSCSTGRITAMLADPGGVAGSLLVAGARFVVAPMWPVHSDVAQEVGEIVLRGAMDGEEPAQALGSFHSRVAEAAAKAPVVSSPEATTNRQLVDLERLGFVVWVG